MFLEGKVKFLPVKVKLHWPDLWCSYCQQECQQVSKAPFEIYWCPSCNHYTAGRTQFIDGQVVNA